MTSHQMVENLEALYGILNDPKRSDARARVVARARLRRYIAQLQGEATAEARKS